MWVAFTVENQDVYSHGFVTAWNKLKTTRHTTRRGCKEGFCMVDFDPDEADPFTSYEVPADCLVLKVGVCVCGCVSWFILFVQMLSLCARVMRSNMCHMLQGLFTIGGDGCCWQKPREKIRGDDFEPSGNEDTEDEDLPLSEEVGAASGNKTPGARSEAAATPQSKLCDSQGSGKRRSARIPDQPASGAKRSLNREFASNADGKKRHDSEQLWKKCNNIDGSTHWMNEVSGEVSFTNPDDEGLNNFAGSSWTGKRGAMVSPESATKKKQRGATRE